MFPVGGVATVLASGSSVAREKISARCCRANNCSSAMGGKVSPDVGAIARW